MNVIPGMGSIIVRSNNSARSAVHNRTSDGFGGVFGKIPSNPSIPDVQKLKQYDNPTDKPSGNPVRRRSHSGSGSGGSARQTFDYYEAPLAEHYGFSQETAYQEALANTAYRREMEDMRRAGLNPSVIYGSHNSPGADAGIIPRSSGGGGGGGSYRRYGRGGSKYAFSGASYYGLMAAAGIGTAIATKNVGAGMAASGIVGTALKAINGFIQQKRRR